MVTVQEAIRQVRDGQPIIVVDAPERENEGDIVIAAARLTAEHINFMATHCRGMICLALEGQVLDRLRLGRMESGTRRAETNFAESFDLRSSVTGLSVEERAAAIRHAISEDAASGDFRSPGKIFPLRYAPGGVLRRPGHTEASVDLARLAGLVPAGVVCEIMRVDGAMARLNELIAFARTHGLSIVTIADIVEYRRRTENIVTRVAEAELPLLRGTWRAVGYRCELDGSEHLALVYGSLEGGSDLLVRVHSECLTVDVFGSKRCDCCPQLRKAMAGIVKAGRGVVIYLRGHEGRGIGLLNKLRAYGLQSQGLDTVDANVLLGLPVDARDYSIAIAMLLDLQVHSIKLLTNNPAKFEALSALKALGIEVTERVPLRTAWTKDNARYLLSKARRLGHASLIPDPNERPDD